jgi:hypothetical protein
MAEQPLPLSATVADVLVLRPLIAAGNAARVALGGLHLGPPPVELVLLVLLSSARRRPGIKRVAPRFSILRTT